jgi:DNA repair protein RadC
MNLANLPVEERPRERLLTKGEEALSLTELLAICLGSGSKGKSVLRLAEELLSHFGTITALLHASIEELMAIKGIGYAKAVQIKAVFGLVKKYTKPVGFPKYRVKCPEDVYTLIASELRTRKQETLILLLRDVKGYVFRHEVISLGSLSQLLIHPREVFSYAISHHAHSIVIAHNHPSGDSTPSAQDIELTKLLYSSGRLMGIRLDDHLIIGAVSFTSLWRKGFLPHRTY